MNFAFTLPTDKKDAETMKQSFLQLILSDYPTLSIIGIDFPKGRKVKLANGIANATANSVIVIDSDHAYDVDWYRDAKHAASDGVKPDGSLPEVWHELISFLNRFVAMQANKMNQKAEAKVQSEIRNTYRYTQPRCNATATIIANLLRKVDDRHATVSTPDYSNNQFYNRVGTTVTPKTYAAKVAPSNDREIVITVKY